MKIQAPEIVTLSEFITHVSVSANHLNPLYYIYIGLYQIQLGNVKIYGNFASQDDVSRLINIFYKWIKHCVSIWLAAERQNDNNYLKMFLATTVLKFSPIVAQLEPRCLVVRYHKNSNVWCYDELLIAIWGV